MDNPFEELLSFSDAAKMWKLDDSTLRKAAANGKFVDGVEVKKFGKQWIITKSAMTNHYGAQPDE